MEHRWIPELRHASRAVFPGPGQQRLTPGQGIGLGNLMVSSLYLSLIHLTPGRNRICTVVKYHINHLPTPTNNSHPSHFVGIGCPTMQGDDRLLILAVAGDLQLLRILLHSSFLHPGIVIRIFLTLPLRSRLV